MKKGIKKLHLGRETVLSLDPDKLGPANGGLDTHFDHTCGSVCDIPSWHCTRCSLCVSTIPIAPEV